MNNQDITDDKLIENLKDAGCTGHTIENFINLYHSESTFQQKKVLAAHRQTLLDKIHKNQKMLDCLDYLIYRLAQPSADKKNKRRSLGNS